MKLTTLILLSAFSWTSVAEVLPEGTKVRVKLEQQLTSATAEVGQPVQFSVSEDIKLNDSVVIPRDSVVNGTIVEAVAKRRMGRTGKLDFSIDQIVTPDGGKIPVRYSLVKKEGGSHAVSTGVITAGVAVVFWPAAPFILLRKGKDTVYNKGMAFEVFTDADYTLKGSPRSQSGSSSRLTNTDIINLKKAGFSDDLIIARIRSSPADFNMSTTMMIELKTSGLSDAIISSMVAKASEK